VGADAVTIRVLLADDQRVVRDGLTLLLDLLPGIEVLDAASDGAQAVELARRLRPDVILMDLRMPRCDGVEATKLLREQCPEVKVIVLTTYADDRSVLDALRAGARGYLTKDAGAAQINETLQRVVSGQAVIDPAVAEHVINAITRDEPRPPPLPDALTPREIEVLTLIADGLSNVEIARRLVISEATVKSHINRLLSKTGVRDRAQAVGYAYRHGLARPDSAPC
jgi:DNA-binding NarL/FixJ family response regulator